jgi:hypothetical protein
MAQAFLHSKQLPKYLWSFAFRQAAYIFNRLVHHGKDVTPVERVLGIKPSLEMLRGFSCEAYAYDHTHKKQMVAYATELRHIGVVADSKGWVFWDPVTKKVSTAISVQFDKNKLHFSPAQPLEDNLDDSVVSAIECLHLGDFTLGDELDAQDALVEALEDRDTYGNNSPTYHEAMRSPVADKWTAAMSKEQKSLEDMEVWVEETHRATGRKFSGRAVAAWDQEGHGGQH